MMKAADKSAIAMLAMAIPAMPPGDRSSVCLDVWLGVLPPSPFVLPSSLGKPFPGMTMKSDTFAAAFWISSDWEEF